MSPGLSGFRFCRDDDSNKRADAKVMAAFARMLARSGGTFGGPNHDFPIGKCMTRWLHEHTKLSRSGMCRICGTVRFDDAGTLRPPYKWAHIHPSRFAP
jgi:hypothetical protein